MLAFRKLRKLSIKTSVQCETILPPQEFLSSITSTQLSEIHIDIISLPSPRKTNRVAALNVVGSYDEALCRLSNLLRSSSGGKRLVLTLKVKKSRSVPDGILPRFSEEGDLKIVQPEGSML